MEFHGRISVKELYMKNIDSIFAFVSVDDEGEGIMAKEMEVHGRMMMMPLIGADMARVRSLNDIAKQISLVSGKEFKIYKFDNKTDITEQIK